MLKTDPFFIPEAPERPQRPPIQWSLGSMCLLALVVCGLAWLTRFALTRDAATEVRLALATTTGGVLFGLYQRSVFRYAAWTFVLTVTVILIGGWAWLIELARARDAPTEVFVILVATAGGALFGSYLEDVFRSAAWTFVLTVTVIGAMNWVVGLQDAIEYEAHPNYWKPTGEPGYYRGDNGEVIHP